MTINDIQGGLKMQWSLQVVTFIFLFNALTICLRMDQYNIGKKQKGELKDKSISGGEEVWENTSEGESHQKTCLCGV